MQGHKNKNQSNMKQSSVPKIKAQTKLIVGLVIILFLFVYYLVPLGKAGESFSSSRTWAEQEEGTPDTHPVLKQHHNDVLFEKEITLDLLGKVPKEHLTVVGTPLFSTRHELRRMFDEFIHVYKRFPRTKAMLGDNVNGRGGMTVPHIFATWAVVKKLKPRMVIESGVFRGVSTWIIAEALEPGSRLVSLDPHSTNVKREDKGITQIFLTNSQFKDFDNLPEWIFYEDTTEGNPTIHKDAKRVPADQILAFMDDHQSASKRVWQGLYRYNIKHYIFEDNYPAFSGDNYSFNWIFHRHWPKFDSSFGSDSKFVKGGDALSILEVPDDFGRTQVKRRWDEHLSAYYFWKNMLQTYQEIPPLCDKVFESARSRSMIEKHEELSNIQPLFTNEEIAKKYPELLEEPLTYTYLCYVKVKDGINSRAD